MSLYLGTTLIAPNQPNSANQSLSNINSTAQENIVDLLYPVGSIYIGTTAECPLAAIKGTWTLVSSGRVLQGADSYHAVGTTISAGLPNITGALGSRLCGSDGLNSIVGASGAFSQGSTTGSGFAKINLLTTLTTYRVTNFDASSSNSIYGRSSTVQPPAYVVNIWERTA